MKPVVAMTLLAAFACACNAGEPVTLGYSSPAPLGGMTSEPLGGMTSEPLGGMTSEPLGGMTSEPPAPPPWPPTFTEITLLSEVNSSAKDDNPTLSQDRLVLCFTSLRLSEATDLDDDANIWCASRDEPSQPFSAPVYATALNTEEFESSPALSADGLEIWFGSKRAGGQGGVDIWRSTRPDRDAAWTTPTIVPELNSTADDIPRPPGGPEAATMPLGSRRLGSNYRTFLAERSGDSFSEPVLVDELGSDTANVVDAFLSADGLVLYYAQTIDGEDYGHLYAARRLSLEAPFEDAVALTTLNSEFDDRDPWLSPDGEELYFASSRSGEFKIYRALLAR